VYAPLTVHLASGNSATQLNRLILCSNNPLTIFEKDEWRQNITANLEFEFFGASKSHLPYSFEKIFVLPENFKPTLLLA